MSIDRERELALAAFGALTSVLDEGLYGLTSKQQVFLEEARLALLDWLQNDYEGNLYED